jgi:hypothetical protein
VNGRRAAALTWFIFGGLTALSGVKNLIRPQEISNYQHPWNEFLFQYGAGLSSLLVGAALIVLGLVTQRAVDPAEGTKELNFIYEAEIPLAPVMSGFLLLIGINSATSMLPYTGERGIEPGQLAASGALIPLMFGGAWFFLHYRRLSILNSASRTLEISYGKPWAVLTLRHEFADFQSVAIEEVQRARGVVYRIVATGTKGSKLITFTFNADSAKQCVRNIVQVTGWAEATALKAAAS